MSSSSAVIPVHVVRTPAPHQKIHVRAVSGRYARWRLACVWLTQIVYYGLPWLQWNQRPAVLFDLAARKFTIFGSVLWPQDLIFLAGFLILCALLLFFLSTVAGRIWCSVGCPHTVYTEIFMWIERAVEGSRSARMQLDRQPLSRTKLRKKVIKHVAWIALALWTGMTLVGYFTPIRALLGGAATLTTGPWETFWIVFYAGLTYLNAGWMREQVCRYMCAYARFQSVMFDRDTLVVSYDHGRGEPRGLRRKHPGPRLRHQGDCVDCTICIQVCPAGIDIRNGLQYECIDCAACIDACDEVMDRIGAARGLIRYASGNAMEKGWSARQMRRRIWRPRVMIYGALLSSGLVLYVAALAMRAPVKLNVIADRNAIGQLGANGFIENVYRLQIMNLHEEAHHYRISVSGMDSLASLGLTGEHIVQVNAVSIQAVPVRLQVPPDEGKPGANRIWFELTQIGDKTVQVREPGVFMMPGGPRHRTGAQAPASSW